MGIIDKIDLKSSCFTFVSEGVVGETGRVERVIAVRESAYSIKIVQWLSE